MGAFANPSIKIPKSKCSPINIRDKMNPELQEGFNYARNQADVGWCYAFVAADLVSAEVGQMVSATHAAYIFNEEIENSAFLGFFYSMSSLQFEDVFEGGFPDKSIELISKRGRICLESDLPYTISNRTQTETFIRDLENAQKKIREGNYEGACEKVKAAVLDSEQEFDFRNIYVLLQKKNINLALSELADKHCSGKQVSVPKLKVKNMRSPKKRRVLNRSKSLKNEQAELENGVNEYFDKIEERLLAGKPVGLNYHSGKVRIDDGSDHTSVLTGRRWRNGRCEFQVREAMGLGCKVHDKKVISDCDYLEGSFWLTDQKFFDIIDEIFYIEGLQN